MSGGLDIDKMVRMCRVKGCKVRQGQGKMLFIFPKDPVMRKLWICRTGRTHWNPTSVSCICENHFDAQWEKIRVDGSRALRHNAVPCLPETDPENIENVENVSPVKSHDHIYTLVTRRPLKDLTNSISVEEVSSHTTFPSNSCDNEIVNNDLVTNINTFPPEEVSFNSLSVFANICSSIEPLPVLACNTNSTSPSKQELWALLKKQKEENETLKREQKTIKKIAIKCSRDYFAIKTQYDKCKLQLWRYKQRQIKSRLALLSRLGSDQLTAIQRQNKGGVKWSFKTIEDALVFKMKWGTTGYFDFVNYLPIFPSVRTLQKEVEHIRFESGILEEVFDMLKCTVSRMTENERDCMIAADEMAIRAGHVFDPSSKKMIGKCTFPTHVGQAKKILAIVCGGICRRWKVVVAYYFTGNEDPELKKQKANMNGVAFKDIIMKIIEKCEAIGLKVHSLTTDMASENRALWKVYGIGCSYNSNAVVSIEHPIRLDDRFFFLPDPVHLFKNILTMLDNNKIITLPQDILCSEKLTHPTVQMQHIDDVLEFELNLELKIAYRLKKSKLHCKNQFKKMKVGTARSVFNRRTEIALRRCAEHTGNAAYKTTAFFVGLVSRWFDYMPNRSLKVALGLKNVAAYEEVINHISKTAYVFRFMTIGVDQCFSTFLDQTPTLPGPLLNSPTLIFKSLKLHYNPQNNVG